MHSSRSWFIARERQHAWVELQRRTSALLWKAQATGDFECGQFYGLRDRGEIGFVDAGRRAGDADASGYLAVCVQDGGADATRARDGLLIVERITELRNLCQVLAQSRNIGDGTRRGVFKTQVRKEYLSLFCGHRRQHRLTQRGAG